MSLLTAIGDKLGTDVAALKGGIQYAADLAALVAAGQMPQRDAAAFIVPLGFDGRGGESATGVHTQILSHAVGVIIVVKARGDASGRKALPAIDDIKDAVIASLAGWAPDDVASVLVVARGRLVSLEGGVVLYQLDFNVLDQLRIMR